MGDTVKPLRPDQVVQLCPPPTLIPIRANARDAVLPLCLALDSSLTISVALASGRVRCLAQISFLADLACAVV